MKSKILATDTSEVDLAETYLTTREAANALGLSALSTVRDYISSGHLRGCFRLRGGKGPWRIPLSSVKAVRAADRNHANAALQRAEFDTIMDSLIQEVA